MKKTDKTKIRITVMVFMALIVTLAFAGLAIGIASAGGPTYVSGIIWSDTTWTLANSPYIVIGDVQIPSGVTLMIEPGVEIQYTGAYEILVKGTIIADGTEADSIVFTSFEPGTSSGARQLKFEGTILDNSQLSYIKMEYAWRAIQIGEETEHNQGGKNEGTLTVSHVTINEADVITDGYDTGARLLLSDAVINSSTIKGTYPRSEEIIIQNATISNCNINSDSYNYGITIENSSVNNSQFTIGCCGANIHIRSSIVLESSIQQGGGSPVVGPLEITGSELINTPVNLPAATVEVSNSIVSYSGSNGLTFGNGLIEYSQVIGNTEGVAVKITGYYGYNIGGSVSISNSIITRNSIGIQITNANVVTVQNNNIFDNAIYNIENLASKDITATNNYWGTTNTEEIAAKIFDYYDDINFGIVDYTPYLFTPDITAPISPPTDLNATAGDSVINLSWSANPETDLAGYKVYYDTDSGYPYVGTGANEGSSWIDVGNVTSYQLSGLINGVKYYVAITAYDTTGDESWYSNEVSATPTEMNQPPTARFTYSPENPVVNETITFNASSSYDPDGIITNYAWDFGDGNTTSTAEPIITHFYSLADDYDVSLTVTDNDGATNSTSKIITVFPPTAIFDTGSPANPYPSIMGNHTGTIKPNHTVIATKLYTYPCTGTGGHTEYAEIWNATWNATATWEGYVGDWHNISFDKTVVLLGNETYNYTIRTGSYPQIHHTDNLTTSAGFITCLEFIDANGKTYTDWIPAIRLE